MATKKPFDWSKFDGMLIFDASKIACSQFLDVSPDTIERRVKEKHKMTFTAYKKIKLETTVLRLKQKMINKALKGDNVCLIFTLKNISDWSDKQELVNEGIDIKIKIDESDSKL